MGRERLCELLEVARSSYYAWKAGAPNRAQRAAADAALTERIRAINAGDRAMGAPRITAEPGEGIDKGSDGRINRKRVARLMRAGGIVGYRKRRRVRTTVPD